LTALAVERTKWRGYYGDGGGLFLQVSAGGAKSWIFRFKADGRRRETRARRVEHHAALPYREVAACMAALRGQERIAARPLIHDSDGAA
jgi:hypothetical protein